MAEKSFPLMSAAKKYASENAGWTVELLQRAFEKEPGTTGFRVSEGLLFAWSGLGKHIIPVDRVVWIHVNQVNHTVLGFTYAKWITFHLQVRPGVTVDVMLGNEEKSKEALAYLFEKLPETAFGHDKALFEMWNASVRAGDKDFDALRQLGRRQHGLA